MNENRLEEGSGVLFPTRSIDVEQMIVRKGRNVVFFCRFVGGVQAEVICDFHRNVRSVWMPEASDSGVSGEGQVVNVVVEFLRKLFEASTQSE